MLGEIKLMMELIVSIMGLHEMRYISNTISKLLGIMDTTTLFKLCKKQATYHSSTTTTDCENGFRLI